MKNGSALVLVVLFFIPMKSYAVDENRGQGKVFANQRAQRAYQKKQRLYANRAARNHRPWFRNRPPAQHRVTHFLGNVGKDIFLLHDNLISWDSFKIFTITFPIFIGARMIDEKLQNCFFNRSSRKNRNSPPQWCHDLAQWSIGVPIILLSSQAFFSRDEEFRTTSQVFLLGLPFVFFAKKLVKKLDFDLCKRPFHEKLAHSQRSMGGFPSGHLAEATYTAVLYGMRYGPSMALPLGALATFVSLVFLTCNRHYLSQLIAGAGFGAAYAVAGNKLIDSKLGKNNDLALNFFVDERSRPTMSIACNF